MRWWPGRCCALRLSVHEKSCDAQEGLRCTWRICVRLVIFCAAGKLNALGKLRCTWRPLSAEKTVARCIGVREAHGGFRNAPKLNACTEAQCLHRRFAGQDLAVEVRWASVYSTQVWKSVVKTLKVGWKNVMYVRFTIIGAREERRCTRRAAMRLANLRALGDL